MTQMKSGMIIIRGTEDMQQTQKAIVAREIAIQKERHMQEMMEKQQQLDWLKSCHNKELERRLLSYETTPIRLNAFEKLMAIIGNLRYEGRKKIDLLVYRTGKALWESTASTRCKRSGIQSTPKQILRKIDSEEFQREISRCKADN